MFFYLAQASSGDSPSAQQPPDANVPADPAASANGGPGPIEPSELADHLWNTLTGFANSFIDHLPAMVIALVIVIITGITAKVVRTGIRRIFRRIALRESLRELFAQLIFIGIWFIGLMAAAMVVFPDFGLGELVATAGLASIAIGFAFQDIFENFFAGILILWNFPFEPGDFIEIESEGIVGRVEDIWIRMSLIRLQTGELVCVPNSTIYKSPVRILTSDNARRQSVACGVAYGEDVTEARQVIHAALQGCQTVRKDRPIEVYLTGFGDSSMDYEVAWWTNPTPAEQRRSRDEVVEAIKKALDAAGIEIPYPYRVLTFTKNEPLIYQTMARRLPESQTDT